MILEIEVVASAPPRSAAGCRRARPPPRPATPPDARERAPRTPCGRSPSHSPARTATRRPSGCGSVSMPTLTRLRRSRLAITSTAATMSGVASANWAATSARRNRRAAGPSVAERPPDRSERSICREAWIAGTRPPTRIRTPLADGERGEPSERAAPTAGLRRRAGCSRRRRSSRAESRSAATPAPTAAAAAVSTRSRPVRCCRSRPREAPSALRMASSRLRSSARAMSRLIAFAHAMRSTQPTAASTMTSVEPTSPTTRDLRSCRPHVAFSSWYDDFQIGNNRAFVARSVSSAAACGTSGRSRPSTVVKNGPLRFGGGQRAAVKSATSRSSGPTSSGARRRPCSWRRRWSCVRPSTAGSLAKRRAQKAARQHGDAIAAGVVRYVQEAARAADWPMRGKYEPVTTLAVTRSAAPPSVTVTLVV